MKLIIQIAFGIILAGLMYFVATLTIAYFAASAIKQNLKTQSIQQEKVIKQRQLENQARLLAEQRNTKIRIRELQEREKRNKEFLEKKRIKRMKEDKLAYEERNKLIRLKEAWKKSYEMPYQCKRPDSKELKKWCQNFENESKKDFFRENEHK